MGFYDDMQIQCVNPNAYYPWYSPKDMDTAVLVSRHIALTSFQLQKLGCSSKVLSRLVKHGILYRYKVTSLGRSLPSIFTAGNTAARLARLPVPRFNDTETLRSILITNQVITSILLKTEAKVDVSLKRPIQIITVNKPIGVMYARTPDYTGVPLRYNLSQAIVIVPNDSYIYPGLPFRYVLEDELGCDDIRYYYSSKDRLLPVNIDFSRKEPAAVQ